MSRRGSGSSLNKHANILLTKHLVVASVVAVVTAAATVATTAVGVTMTIIAMASRVTLPQSSPLIRQVHGFQLLQLLANGEEGDMRLAGEVISQPSTDEQREQQGLIDIEDREHATTDVADARLLRWRGNHCTNQSLPYTAQT